MSIKIKVTEEERVAWARFAAVCAGRLLDARYSTTAFTEHSPDSFAQFAQADIDEDAEDAARYADALMERYYQRFGRQLRKRRLKVRKVKR